MNNFRPLIAMFFFPLLLLFEVHWMYPSEPIIRFPLILVFTLFLVAFVGALGECSFSQKNFAFNSFILLEGLILFLAYMHFLFYPPASTFYYLTISLPLLLFLYSYSLTKINLPKLLPLVSLFMVLIFSIVYLLNRRDSIEELLRTDSGCYTILYYVPFVFCLKNKFVKIMVLLLCFISVLLSFKRGGIVCLFAGLYVYAIACIIQGSDLSKKIKRLCIALIPLVLVVIVTYYVNGIFDDYLFNRFSALESSGGSGRDKIYANVLDMIANSSWFELIVGHGSNTVLRDSYLGFSAHNDFLECIYDYGIITFAAYLLLYVSLVKLMLDMLKRDSFYAPPLAASLVMFLSNSLVSHILLYDWHFMTFALFWGYIVACDERERLLQNLSISSDANKLL